MSAGFGTERERILGVIYAEDFDEPARPHQPPAETRPPPAEPLSAQLTLEDLVQAEQHGRAEGFAAGQEQASRDLLLKHETERHAALLRLENNVDTLCATLSAAIEERARFLSRSALDAIGQLLPTVQAMFGDVEMLAVNDAVLSGLREDMRIELHVSAASADTLRRHCARTWAGRELPVVVSETMADGDILLLWPGGQAVRSGQTIVRQIIDTLNQSNAKATGVHAA
ncbi:hypothetical protein AA103196_0355 [Ameyamaea chiangmaiensis NBRC 103196]|uniref:Flagellar assembly protein FliH/Type III secretion system HrpE domain-containing protein n=1 Tax=Ameyamaea chiangmaiensis TaxID=442969 RepID=A0A850PB14_9PROT|nr:hypothetical protein [Ameyamaea chiangmaiensis]MBS4074752.1 hypothetical protein [Ameyamaea chiangmaiensis]NVN40133.1 hypothetical protein [Ameyamaea chiangmaiensis]GBQ62616.1 hypothetical protein AA103196_0355 [Ameyamaea chiangmaiensis NBRC 103196]